MTEPLHSTGAAIAAGGGASILTGAISGDILGLSASALLFGFMGGFCALIYMQQMKWQGQAATVFGSTFIGGIFAPMLFSVALHYFEWLAPFGNELRIACAFALGLLAPIMIPIGIAYARKTWGASA